MVLKILRHCFPFVQGLQFYILLPRMLIGRNMQDKSMISVEKRKIQIRFCNFSEINSCSSLRYLENIVNKNCVIFQEINVVP